MGPRLRIKIWDEMSVEKTIEKLLTHFGSVKRIKEANAEDLQAIIGKATTKQVITFFAKDKVKDEGKLWVLKF